jgi:DNA-directed RNA polymerase alpha subunit
MRESVLDLLLNLKEIFFKKRKNNYSLYKKKSQIYNQMGTSYFKPLAGFLKVKGPGVIRAKDLKLPPFLECVDPEQYIATLAEDGLLCMKFIIMEGKGYLLPMNSNIDNNLALDCESAAKLVKNRLNFLNEIKSLKKKNSSQDHFANISDSRAVKAEGSTNAKQKSPSEQPTTIGVGSKGGESTTLYLDTVFNPVTKVSYMIEDFDNKIVYDSNLKVNFVDDISTLIESSNYLRNNYPFLLDEVKQREKEISSFPTEISNVKKSSTMSFNQPKGLIDLVDTYSTSEIKNLSSSLHPLKKQNSLHTIVLEVWTNGSLHPRDALYLAFEKLAIVFLNMKKTISYDSIYLNESSLLIASLAPLTPSGLEGRWPAIEGPDIEAQSSDSTSLSYTLPSYNVTGDYSYSGQDKREENEIEFLNISLRPYTLLKRSNINTVSDLCQLTINDLQYIMGFNNKYVNNVVNCLTIAGLSLASI